MRHARHLPAARRDAKRRGGTLSAAPPAAWGLRAWALPRLPEVAPGDDLPALLAARAAAGGVAPGDAVCVAHKVVSKAEGRVVALADVTPGAAARSLAEESGKTPELCELILAESRRIIRRRRGTLICETHHGFICANAGIDQSNVAAGKVVLLPADPDASARRLQAAVARAVGGRVGLVVTDTHGRPFRRGLVNVAIGAAGFEAVIDHRGGRDREGRVLVATDQGLADELAAAGGILMGKDAGVAAVAVSGVPLPWAPGGAAGIVRTAGQDLFRDGEPAG